MKRNWLIVLAAACFSILTACGGGNDEVTSTNPNSFTAESKSQVMGPVGGSITLTLANGAVFQFEVPPGALTSSTTLSLATQEATAGQRFNLVLQPAGLILVNGAVGTLTITLPSGQTLPTTGGMAYDGVLIPYTTLPDGRLQVSLSEFSGQPTAMASVNFLNTFNLKNTNLAVSSNACGNAPFLSASNGGLTAVDAVEIELYGQCMVSTVQALAANEQFAEAVRVSNSVAAYLQSTGSGNAGQHLAQASSISCTAYGLALDRARTRTVTTLGTLYPLIKPILFWENTVQRLGASCSGIPTNEYQTVINAKTAEAEAYYKVLKPNLTDTSSTNYAAAKTEAGQSTQTKNEVLALQPSTGVRSTVTSDVSQRAQPGLLDAMLQAPWNRCNATADYGELISLMTIMENPDSVKNAAQYCGTVLNAQAKNASFTVIAQLAQPLGGVSANVTRATDSIVADKTGWISINGPIQALKCPADSTGGSESLVVKIDGLTTHTFTSPPYLNNALEINLANALEAAHPNNTANLTMAALTVERTGTPCGGFWGSNPAPLLNLSLAISPPKIVYMDATTGDIYVVNADGTGSTNLGVSGLYGNPAWSRDHAKIAFSNGDQGISIINADGSGLSNIPLPSGTRNDQPSWSPDGTRIAFTQQASANSLCIINIDGSGLTCMPYETLIAYSSGWGGSQWMPGPSWSPDGTKITYSGPTWNNPGPDKDFHQVGNIYVVNANGSGISNLTKNTIQRNSFDQTWSPDGTKIAYVLNDDNIFTSNIYVMNADGSGQVLIATDLDLRSPSWSPDGSRIVFHRQNSTYNGLSIMNADGGGMTNLNIVGTAPAW